MRNQKEACIDCGFRSINIRSSSSSTGDEDVDDNFHLIANHQLSLPNDNPFRVVPELIQNYHKMLAADSDRGDPNDDIYLLDEKQKDKRRRQKKNKRISGKLQTLRNLIPHCYKKDDVAILDDTAKYIKSLQLQIEMMSRWNGQSQPQQAPYVTPTYIPVMMRPDMMYVGAMNINVFGGVQSNPQVTNNFHI
ncbi:transcription factor PIL1-like [Beta vulgaris subsp. vulgaris]|uniref:transcription factor PIL1-like n=1 Tax=Beta vulgaris subsp. vulgaris TaxID=3555 RepID=UPI0020368537|nr:transcription factor PIL1-like [Beta vulgaris subsp. vulgaris]